MAVWCAGFNPSVSPTFGSFFSLIKTVIQRLAPWFAVSHGFLASRRSLVRKTLPTILS